MPNPTIPDWIYDLSFEEALKLFLYGAFGETPPTGTGLPVTAGGGSGTDNVNLAQVGGATFALGQALAAASLPVVLTAAQISTLTPLSTVAATQSGTWTVGLSAAQTLATVTTVGTVTNLSQMGGVAINLGNGAVATGTQRVALGDIGVGEYETVAASATAQVLGGTGAIGDYISGLLVIPATTSPGNVLLLDSATSITVFAGGASSVSNLVPFFIPLGMYSVSGAWKVTTGTNVSVIGIGNFTT